MSEANAVDNSALLAEYGYFKCEWDQSEDPEQCEQCGCWPSVLYCHTDYWGESDYACEKCILDMHEANEKAYAEADAKLQEQLLSANK